MAKFQSKFRQNRADANKSDDAGKAKGARSQASAEGLGKMSEGQEEKLEEQVAPGIHDKVAAKARELHLTHDDGAGRHHVHAVNSDGTENHTDHASREEAHLQAATAAGVNYPMNRENPETDSNPQAMNDDFEPNVE